MAVVERSRLERELEVSRHRIAALESARLAQMAAERDLLAVEASTETGSSEIPLLDGSFIQDMDVNAVQINISKMTDTQLLDELRSDPVMSKSLQSFIPQLNE